MSTHCSQCNEPLTRDHECEVPDWIADRIRAEYNKHAKHGLDWAGIAAAKIRSEINHKLMDVL